MTQFSGLPKLDHPLFINSCFLAGGVAFGRYHSGDPFILAGIAALLILGLSKAPSRFKALLCFSFIIGFALIWRHDHRTAEADSVARLIPLKNASIIAEVIATESYRPYNIRYLLSIKSVNGQKASGRARWYARFGQIGFTPEPGDIISITHSKISPPRGYHNEGGWDYELYMRDRNIEAIVTMRKNSKLERIGGGFNWRLPVEKIKNTIRNNLKSERNEIAAISRAMLIGDNGLLTPETRDIFSRAGTAHLLAVSGLHIGFIAMGCFFIVKPIVFAFSYLVRYQWASAGVPTRVAALAAIVAVLFYAALTGPRLPSARAAIMITTYLLAIFFGRGRDFYGAFGAALLIILISMPYALFEAGFQLSFIVVFSIVIFMEQYWKPIFQTDQRETIHTGFWPGALRHFPIAGSWVALSFFAAIASAPLTAYYFNVIPMYGVLANAILVPLTSITVPWGIIFSSGISDTASGITSYAMGIIVDTSAWIASWPFAYKVIGSIPAVSVGLYYFALGGFTFVNPGKLRRRIVALAVTGFIISLGVAPLSSALDKKLTIRFVDVGQGDSAVITWPDGGGMVIDAGGRYKNFDIGRSIVAPVLLRAQRTNVSAMVITHSDNDHMGGAVGLNNFVSSDILFDNGLIEGAHEKYFRMRGEALLKGAYQTLKAGDRLVFPGGLKVDVLNPPERDLPYPNNQNNVSLILKLTFGEVRVLMVGDIGKDVERYLVESGADIRADVLKVGHHGSGSSSTAKFLKAVGAKTAVISAGYKNRFRHPNKKALRRLKNAGMKIYRTDLDGEIVMRTDGKSIEWKTYFDNE